MLAEALMNEVYRQWLRDDKAIIYFFGKNDRPDYDYTSRFVPALYEKMFLQLADDHS